MCIRDRGIEETAEQLLLMTQYFDTMQDVARNGRSNVLLLPNNPGQLGNLSEEIRTTLLQVNAVREANDNAEKQTPRTRKEARQKWDNYSEDLPDIPPYKPGS